MIKIKKIFYLCLALTACCSFGFAGCNDHKSESSPVNTDTEQSGSGDTSGDDGYDECEHEWVWTLEKEPTCTENGTKTAVCTIDSAHKQTLPVEKRGHEFDNGVCVRCQSTPTVPAAPDLIEYVNNYDEGNPFEERGETGEEYNRYEVKLNESDGYYEFEIGREKTWLSLSVPEAGQYAIYTVGNLPDGVSITRYDASVFYIPANGEKARVLGENDFLPAGTLFSDVNCATTYWNTQWRATWSLEAPVGSVVKVRFVRIGAPAWTPSYVYETVVPTQINGVKAPEGAETHTPVDVPYESGYFYDETCGYYRMGTKDAPGEIIYAAISAPAARLLGEQKFTTIQYEGNNLSLGDGYTVDGDYFVKNYVSFIMNNGGDQNATADATANCYQNYVNSDGLYPVTAELYDFLTLYARKNRPFEISDEIWNDETARKEKAWLSACYYYEELVLGSADRPIEILPEQFGTDIAVDTIEWDYVYYTVTAGSAACTIACENENALLLLGENVFTGPFSVKVEAGETVTFMLAATDGSATSYAIRITTDA
ncbi:MAG: hypothetical protein IJX91_05815 [Clostridia bacterium]|nr:hypothetical protein [Clostridia bacterium]